MDRIKQEHCWGYKRESPSPSSLSSFKFPKVKGVHLSCSSFKFFKVKVNSTQDPSIQPKVRRRAALPCAQVKIQARVIKKFTTAT